MAVPSSGMDPTYVMICEAFESVPWSFEKIRDVVEAMTSENAGSLGSGWSKLGDDTEQAVADFGRELSVRIADAWAGSAAESGSRAVATYAENAPAAGQYFRGVSTTLSELTGAVDLVRSSTPEYISKGGFWNTITPWSTADEEAYYARHQEALNQLSTFSGGLRGVDGTVPQFEAPVIPIDLSGDAVPGGVTGPATGGGSGTGVGGGGGGAVGGAGTGADPTGEALGDSASDTSGTSPASAGGLGDGAAGTSPASVSPAGALGDGARTGGLGASGLGGGAGGGAAAGLGGGAGGGALGGLAGAAPGGVMGAAPGAAAGNPAGGLKAGAGAAGAGRGMMGGMMGGAGGARGNGDQDKEHKTPGYLVTLDNGTELIGKLPPVSPPVIGG
ncbi:hypothetical protein [Rhodococcus sp. HNM0569]|uniref:hypothetical protein n=1 Tax=Rhodococcus sp. HNM0569 TaxID=2716340 RepID=UPI00146F50CB|nr:hypothetical protein [Rhodococcus sp. HNM0569]NLU81945.1 hypothetical protein [Rhodococcus sp. HNM0569]